MVTDDRLRVRLLEFLKAHASRKDWIGPASVLISLVATLVTADFKDKWLSKDSWTALFVFAAIAAGAWLVTTLLAMRNNKLGLDDLVSNLKADSATAAGRARHL